MRFLYIFLIPLFALASAITTDTTIQSGSGNEAAGQVTGTTSGSKRLLDTGSTPEDVWGPGGLYTGQPEHSVAADTVDVSSSSANDTSAGTGARTIRLSGLDENWAEQTEDITMNGTTDVVSVNQWKRVNRVIVLTAGSGGSNAGLIEVEYTSTPATVFAQVPIGTNQSVIAALTVPAGKTMYVKRMRFSMARASGAAGSAIVSFRTREENGVYRARRYETISTSFPMQFTNQGALALPAKTDIIMRVESVSDNNSQVAGAFEYILVDN